MHATVAPHGNLRAANRADGDGAAGLTVHPHRRGPIRPSAGKLLIEHVARLWLTLEPDQMHRAAVIGDRERLHRTVREASHFDRRKSYGSGHEQEKERQR